MDISFLLVFLLFLAQPAFASVSNYNEDGSPTIIDGVVVAGTVSNTNADDSTTWDIVESNFLNRTNNATVSYNEGGTTGKYRNYTGVIGVTTTSWGVETALDEFSATQLWRRHAVNPVRDDAIIVIQDSAANPLIRMQQLFASDTAIYIATTDALTTTKKFDVAYETLSGRAIIAFQNETATTTIGFLIWNGTNLIKAGGNPLDSSDNSVASSVGSAAIRWVQLVPHPFKDDIMMISLDAGSDVYAQLWNGTSWSPSTLIDSGASSATNKIFDFKWENSGDGVLVYGEGTTQTPRYRTYNGSNSTPGFDGERSMNTVTGTIAWVEGASSFVSDHIMFCISESTGSDLNCFPWDGNRFLTSAEPSTGLERVQAFTVAWEGQRNSTTGVDAVVVWGNLNTDPPSSRVWDGATLSPSGGWRGAAVALPDRGGDPQGFTSISNPNGEDIIVPYTDDTTDLLFNVWNGIIFNTAANTANYDLTATLVGTTTEPWSVFWSANSSKAEINHISAAISESVGDISNLNVTYKFKSDIRDTFQLQIYNYSSGFYESGGCTSPKNITTFQTNTFYYYSCNRSTTLGHDISQYINDGGKLRVRLMSLANASTTLAKMQVDFVQFSIGYSSSPINRYVNKTVAITMSSNDLSNLQLGRGFTVSITPADKRIKIFSVDKEFEDAMISTGADMRGSQLGRLFTANAIAASSRTDILGIEKLFTTNISPFTNRMKDLSLGKLFTVYLTSISNEIKGTDFARSITTSFEVSINHIKNLNLARLFNGYMTIFSSKTTGSIQEFEQLITTSFTMMSNEIEGLDLGRLFTSSMSLTGNNLEELSLGRLFVSSLSETGNDVENLGYSKYLTAGIAAFANNINNLQLAKLFNVNLNGSANDIWTLNIGRFFAAGILESGNKIEGWGWGKLFTTSITSSASDLKNIGYLRMFTANLAGSGNEIQKLDLGRLFTASLSTISNEIIAAIQNIRVTMTASFSVVGNDADSSSFSKLFSASLTSFASDTDSLGYLRMSNIYMTTTSTDIEGLQLSRFITSDMAATGNDLRNLKLTDLFNANLVSASNELKSFGVDHLITARLIGTGNNVKSLDIIRTFADTIAFNIKRVIDARFDFAELVSASFNISGSNSRGLSLTTLLESSLSLSSNDEKSAGFSELLNARITGYAGYMNNFGYLKSITAGIAAVGNEIRGYGLTMFFTDNLSGSANDARGLGLTRLFTSSLAGISNDIINRLRDFGYMITASFNTSDSNLHRLDIGRLFTANIVAVDSDMKRFDVTFILNNLMSFFQSLLKSIFVPEAAATSTTTTTTTQSSGSGGGSTSIGIPTVTPAPSDISPAKPSETRTVEFSKTPIMQEIASGQSSNTQIILKNKLGSDVKNLKISVEGIPSDWVKISDASMDLNAGATDSLHLDITVPKDAETGDRIVVIKINDKGSIDSSSFILRVNKQPTENGKQSSANNPTVSRNIQVNNAEGNVEVKLKVSMSNSNRDTVEVYEEIPKTIANSTKQIKFDVEPTQILRDDPLVLWRFGGLNPTETKEITYTISKSSSQLKDLTAYLYWPLKQLNIYNEKLPTGFRLVEFSIPDMYAGSVSKMELTIENPEDEPKQFEMSMELPANWESTPQKIDEIIGAHETRKLSIDVNIPDNAIAGNYITKVVFTWNGASVVREYVIQLKSATQMITYWLPIILVMGVGVSFAVRYYALKRKSYAPHRNALEKLKHSLYQQRQQKSFETKQVIGIDKEKLKREIIEELKRKAYAVRNQ